jgi:amino acid permease
MEKKYSFWERIKSDTPLFFKKLQVLGAGLVTLSLSLSKIGVIPPVITGIAAAVGTTLAAVAQLAVKQNEPENETK